MSKSLIAKTMAAIAAGSMLVAVAGCSEQKKEETKTEAPAAAPEAPAAPAAPAAPQEGMSGMGGMGGMGGMEGTPAAPAPAEQK